MSTYLFVYRAPRDYQPGNQDGMIAWQTWFEELGSAMVDEGNPIFSRTTVGTATSDTDLGGYSLVSADSVDAAAEMAHGCPFIKIGGGVEIGEITPLSELGTTTTAEDHARAIGLCA